MNPSFSVANILAHFFSKKKGNIARKFQDFTHFFMHLFQYPSIFTRYHSDYLAVSSILSNDKTALPVSLFRIST